MAGSHEINSGYREGGFSDEPMRNTDVLGKKWSQNGLVEIVSR